MLAIAAPGVKSGECDMHSGVRARLVSMVGLLLTFGSMEATAAGISARFGDAVATVGRDVVVRVEVEDQRRITERVVVEYRADDEDWRPIAASRDGPWWTATITSTTVWRAGGIGVAQPEQIELRAFLYGARGGVLLVIGEIEPLTVDVFQPAETEARERALAVYSNEDDDGLVTLTGYVGTEGRAGSSARARLFIGVGGNLAQDLELLVYVTVGPAFSRPAVLENGGPLVLGFDLALRFFARPPLRYDWSPFVEPFANVDLRLPGVDVGGGARAGVLFTVSSEIAVEVSLGGGLMILNASDPGGRDTELGAAGTLRLAARFGGAREDPTEAR